MQINGIFGIHSVIVIQFYALLLKPRGPQLLVLHLKGSGKITPMNFGLKLKITEGFQQQNYLTENYAIAHQEF